MTYIMRDIKSNIIALPLSLSADPRYGKNISQKDLLQSEPR
jgi:hypothetical protein